MRNVMCSLLALILAGPALAGQFALESAGAKEVSAAELPALPEPGVQDDAGLERVSRAAGVNFTVGGVSITMVTANFVPKDVSARMLCYFADGSGAVSATPTAGLPVKLSGSGNTYKVDIAGGNVSHFSFFSQLRYCGYILEVHSAATDYGSITLAESADGAGQAEVAAFAADKELNRKISARYSPAHPLRLEERQAYSGSFITQAVARKGVADMPALSGAACGWQDPSADREFTFEGGPFNYTGEAGRAMDAALAALEGAGYYVKSKTCGYYGYTITFLAPPSAEIKTLTETFFSSAGVQEKADARAEVLKRRGAVVLEKRVASSGYTIRYLVAPPVPCEEAAGR